MISGLLRGNGTLPPEMCEQSSTKTKFTTTAGSTSAVPIFSLLSNYLKHKDCSIFIDQHKASSSQNLKTRRVLAPALNKEISQFLTAMNHYEVRVSLHLGEVKQLIEETKLYFKVKFDNTITREWYRARTNRFFEFDLERLKNPKTIKYCLVLLLS